MRKFNTYSLGVDRGSKVLFSDFEHDGEMWIGTGPRAYSEAIAFSEPFVTAPVVHVSMSMWDIDRAANQRVDISAENVTASGFEAVFRTWGDTRVARVRMDWIAFGEVTDDSEWELY